MDLTGLQPNHGRTRADSVRPTAPELELAVEALRRTGRMRLPVTGASMAPVLVPGDEIEVVSCRARDLHLGDIVLFAARDTRGELAGLVVHRLLLDREEGLIARGDGASTVDPIWSRDSVLGVVETRVRGGLELKLSPRRGSFARRVLAVGWRVRTGTLGSIGRRVFGKRRPTRASQAPSDRAPSGRGGSRSAKSASRGSDGNGHRSRQRPSRKGASIDPSIPLNLRFPPPARTAPSEPTLAPPEAVQQGETEHGTQHGTEPTQGLVPSPVFGPAERSKPSEPAVAAVATPPSRPTRPARERRRSRGGLRGSWRFIRRLARP